MGTWQTAVGGVGGQSVEELEGAVSGAAAASPALLTDTEEPGELEGLLRKQWSSVRMLGHGALGATS